MIDYSKIKAIPTRFDGRQFRSRLEAKWAAFFDLLGWRFEYEPLDFGSWSPDFVIIGREGREIYVEVKPISTLDNSVTEKIDRAIPEGKEALIVGLAPFEIDWMSYGRERPLSIGWYGQSVGVPGEGLYWAEAPFAWYLNAPRFNDFTHAYGSFSGALTGLYDGGDMGRRYA